MPPSAQDITRHHPDEPPEGEDAWVPPHRQVPYEIRVVEPDPLWPESFDRVAARIRHALGGAALEVHHVGSTSVPGLPAKPVIDVDLVVADPADEASYVPSLVAAGFVHVVREPWWHEHRLLKLADPVSFVHVFAPDCPEVVRHLMFREWLLAHPEDLALYARTKRAAAVTTNAEGGHGMDYNRHKAPVVRAIYERMFRAHGLLD